MKNYNSPEIKLDIIETDEIILTSGIFGGLLPGDEENDFPI